MLKPVFGAVAVMLLMAAPAFADALPPEPQGFTLEVALATAMRHNPSIQVAEAQLEQAKLDKQIADLWWAKAINANANYVVGNNPFATQVTATGAVLPTAAVGVGVNLGDILSGPKHSAISQQAITIAEANLRKATLDVASAVTAAYQDYQGAKQLASISGETVQAAETDMKVIERSFARGQSPTNTLVDARLAVARSRVDQVQGGGTIAKSWSTLLGLMGDTSWAKPGDQAEGK